MLVCSVSLRAPRPGITAEIIEAIAADATATGHIAEIAAEITEAIEATDATATGNVVFAALVDDPSSLVDSFSAFLGQAIVEAASASDIATSGAVLATAIVEAVTATSAEDATVTGLAVRRERMIIGLWLTMVNSSAPRDTNVDGVMVNL